MLNMQQTLITGVVQVCVHLCVSGRAVPVCVCWWVETRGGFWVSSL